MSFQQGGNRPPQGRPNGHQRYGQGQGGPPPKLPDAYMQTDSYFINGCLRREFLVDWARQIAIEFENARLTAGQIRRFFSDARRIELRIRLAIKDEKPTCPALNDFYKFAAIAEDAVQRRVAPPIFARFIEKNVERVKNAEDFLDGFLPHFECVVGFANLQNERR